MKAAVIKNAGGPENILIEERAIPTSKEGWVLIKVRAFGLNRSELMTRKGLSPGVLFPRILGIECVGEVESDPSGEFTTGQKVAAFMGGWAGILMAAIRNIRSCPKLYSFPLKVNYPGNN